MIRSSHAPILLTLAAVAILGTAYFFEFVLGLEPCQLCLYQRIPWWIAIGTGCLAISMRQRPVLMSILTVLTALTILSGAGIAGFHAGVEFKWWEGPTACSGGIVGDTVDALKEAIMGAPVVRCDEVPWSLFGISMAGYNFLLSVGLGLYGFAAAVRGK